MAEIAIPLMALGSLYIMQNQKKKDESKCAEKFTNMGIKQVPNLPNHQTPVINYPVENNHNLASNPRRYPSGQAATDKYFQEQVYKNKTQESNNDSNEFQSLTGKKITANDLEHNNMVPFFGSKVTQRTVGHNGNESVLDSYSGSGSQIVHKREQAPLFAPSKNMTHANGAPSYTDFLQSRVNPGTRMANVKPWDEVRVGPGLNKGYTSSGSDGFNAGMEAQQDWKPKTVDELRTKTNPKMVYNGVVLGANAGRGRGARGIEGKVEKNRPDTFYVNSPDRWFTTGGQEKAQTAQPEQVLRAENRPGTTREYFGVGGASKEHTGTYQDGQYNVPKRPQLDPLTKYPGHATNSGSWGIMGEGEIGDYGKGSIKCLPNSRNLTSTKREMGPVSRGIWAAVTPVLDALRPSRKENVIGTIRPTGNAHTTVSKSQVYNPSERTKTTIREQTENTKYTMQGGHNHGGGYATHKHQPVDNQRDTTSCEYIGNSSAAPWATGPREYGADYNAYLNADKEQISKIDRMNQGCESLFNGNQNITTWKSAGTGTVASEGLGNYPKCSSNVNTIGALSGKHTRERAIDCQRMDGEILSAFKSNPYAKSLHSVA